MQLWVLELDLKVASIAWDLADKRNDDVDMFSAASVRKIWHYSNRLCRYVKIGDFCRLDFCSEETIFLAVSPVDPFRCFFIGVT